MFTISNNFLEKIKNFKKPHIHIVMIATKPDIIKQAPIFKELQKRGEQVILIHTGQHYDFNLSGGMLEEFGLIVDLNLNIEGSYHHKVAQIISRMGDVFEKIKSLGKTSIPYVHGDTMTSMACANAAWSNMVGCVHVEAGIRSIGLKKGYYKKFIEGKINFKQYRKLHLDEYNYEGGMIEPYPEQYNTRCSEPASGLFITPSKIAKENLIREGFRKDRIFFLGNSVADATKETLSNVKNSNIFEQYPELKNGFIRFCIHRRENCEDKKRFSSIFEGMERLIKKGYTVLLISLFATEKAIDNFGFRENINKLTKKSNFIYSKVWPFYNDVIAAMLKCKVCATDSGSMQEEMNILGIPTVTLRFGTDRPESCFAGGNVIAPLYSGEIIEKIILGALESKQMKKIKNIYGNNVSKKTIDKVMNIIKSGEEMFETYKL